MSENKHNQSGSKFMNSTSYSHMSQLGQESELNKQKRRTIKKILLISTMDKDVMKNLLKMHSGGPSFLEQKDVILERLSNYYQTILEKDKQDVLAKLFNELESQDFRNYDLFIKIIKYFVLSPVEKSYIDKIEQELQESQKLDFEIEEVQKQIDEEKQKKLLQYSEEKAGKTKGSNKETCDFLLREISIHENKLEKSNQKLNEIVSHNNKLRDKINQLRKEKNVIEEIHSNLKKELEEKKLNVEKTIKSAGDAYYNRNRAEDELKALQIKAEQQKQDFEAEYKKLNKDIQYDRRFKQFIKSKQKDKDILQSLEKTIKRNQEIIQEKMASNTAIDTEYQMSEKKEQEIKKAFDRIKLETGISESKEKETKELLNVFISLYQKNTVMSKFVKELTEEVEDLENKIEEKKKEIQMYNTKGATNDNQRRELKIALMNKIQQEEKKKEILVSQYEKSIETISLIKGYLEGVFKAIDIDQETIDKLKLSAITEENMIYFLGILEQKGIDAISDYARLIAEQLKLEKGDQPGVAQQINDLNNIIAYENANIMNYYSQNNQQKPECPDDILGAKEDENEEYQEQKTKNNNGFFTQDDLRKAAIETLNKKYLPSNANVKLIPGVTKGKTSTKIQQSSIGKQINSKQK